MAPPCSRPCAPFPPPRRAGAPAPGATRSGSWCCTSPTPATACWRASAPLPPRASPARSPGTGGRSCRTGPAPSRGAPTSTSSPNTRPGSSRRCAPSPMRGSSTPAAGRGADPPLRTTALYDGPLVSIADWSCRGEDTRAGAEELASGHQLLIARSGVFATRRGGEALVVGPAQALFQNAGDPYRVSHPVPGGDRCTVLRFSFPAITEALAGFEPASRDRPHAPFRVGHAPVGLPVLLRLHRLRQRLLRGEASTLEAEEEALEVLRGAAGDAYRARGTPGEARLPAT